MDCQIPNGHYVIDGFDGRPVKAPQGMKLFDVAATQRYGTAVDRLMLSRVAVTTDRQLQARSMALACSYCPSPEVFASTVNR